MKAKDLVLKSIIVLLIFVSCNNKNESKMENNAPVATIIPEELVIHDNKRIDNYFWMRNRDSKEVLEYLNAENDYTKDVMSDTEEFQEELYNEMLGRIKQDDSSVPYKLTTLYTQIFIF